MLYFRADVRTEDGFLMIYLNSVVCYVTSCFLFHNIYRKKKVIFKIGMVGGKRGISKNKGKLATSASNLDARKERKVTSKGDSTSEAFITAGRRVESGRAALTAAARSQTGILGGSSNKTKLNALSHRGDDVPTTTAASVAAVLPNGHRLTMRMPHLVRIWRRWFCAPEPRDSILAHKGVLVSWKQGASHNTVSDVGAEEKDDVPTVVPRLPIAALASDPSSMRLQVALTTATEALAIRRREQSAMLRAISPAITEMTASVAAGEAEVHSNNPSVISTMCRLSDAAVPFCGGGHDVTLLGITRRVQHLTRLEVLIDSWRVAQRVRSLTSMLREKDDIIAAVLPRHPNMVGEGGDAGIVVRSFTNTAAKVTDMSNTASPSVLPPSSSSCSVDPITKRILDDITWSLDAARVIDADSWGPLSSSSTSQTNNASTRNRREETRQEPLQWIDGILFEVQQEWQAVLAVCVRHCNEGCGLPNMLRFLRVPQADMDMNLSHVVAASARHHYLLRQKLRQDEDEQQQDRSSSFLPTPYETTMTRSLSIVPALRHLPNVWFDADKHKTIGPQSVASINHEICDSVCGVHAHQRKLPSSIQGSSASPSSAAHILRFVALAGDPDIMTQLLWEYLLAHRSDGDGNVAPPSPGQSTTRLEAMARSLAASSDPTQVIATQWVQGSMLQLLAQLPRSTRGEEGEDERGQRSKLSSSSQSSSSLFSLAIVMGVASCSTSDAPSGMVMYLAAALELRH